MKKPLRYDRRPPLSGPTVTLEECDPLSFTSGDPSPGSEWGAKRFGRPDCTDPLKLDHNSTPRPVRIVTFASIPVGTKPHTRMHNKECRLTSGFAPYRRGFKIATGTFPLGWGINPGSTVSRTGRLIQELGGNLGYALVSVKRRSRNLRPRPDARTARRSTAPRTAESGPTTRIFCFARVTAV